jgi:starch synthase
LDELFSEVAKMKKVDTIEQDDNFLDSYFNLYNELVG